MSSPGSAAASNEKQRNDHLDQKLTKPSPTNEVPSHGEYRRNDLLVAGLVIFALFLGFGIRNQVYNASKSVKLGENLPRIAYPDRWRERTSPECC